MEKPLKQAPVNSPKNNFTSAWQLRTILGAESDFMAPLY